MSDFFIDLEKVRLSCFEERVSDIKLESYVQAVEAGDEMPAVSAMKINDDAYILTWERGGGKTRAAAHYITGRPLRCIPGSQLFEVRETFQVKDLIIEDDKKMGGWYRSALRNDPNIRMVIPDPEIGYLR